VKSILAKLWRFLRLPKNFQLLIMRLIQDQFLIGVTGIIFNDKQEILVFKHSYRQTVWSLPGGYLKSKEHPQEGLEREINEESGLVVSVDQQLKTRTDRSSARLDMCYVGKFIGGEFTPSHEVTEYGFFSFDNLPLISANQLYLIELAINRGKNSVEETLVKVDPPTSFISRLKFLFGTGSNKK
jgi:8-oxo-dGTP diphosphatase